MCKKKEQWALTLCWCIKKAPKVTISGLSDHGIWSLQRNLLPVHCDAATVTALYSHAFGYWTDSDDWSKVSWVSKTTLYHIAIKVKSMTELYERSYLNHCPVTHTPSKLKFVCVYPNEHREKTPLSNDLELFNLTSIHLNANTCNMGSCTSTCSKLGSNQGPLRHKTNILPCRHTSYLNGNRVRVWYYPNYCKVTQKYYSR